MEFVTAKQAAELWGISPRRVAILCKQGRIEEAQKAGSVWLLPPGAEKPKDARVKKTKKADNITGGGKK